MRNNLIGRLLVLVAVGSAAFAVLPSAPATEASQFIVVHPAPVAPAHVHRHVATWMTR